MLASDEDLLESLEVHSPSACSTDLEEHKLHISEQLKSPTTARASVDEDKKDR